MITFLGILSGFALLFYAIFQQGGVTTFLNFPAAMITFGGTLAALFISYPYSRVLGGVRSLLQALKSDIQQPSWVIALMVNLALKARRKSLLSLDEDMKKINNDFIRRGLEMVIDGHPPELIRDVLETELDFMENRHQQGVMVFRSGAKFSPAFGLIGTLIGLVTMLKQMGASNGMQELGNGMAVALITTFYGALAANLFFTPIADKLKTRSVDEILRGRIVLEGILMIQAGMNPRIIERKLNSYLPPEFRSSHYEQLLKKVKSAARARAAQPMADDAVPQEPASPPEEESFAEQTDV